MKMNQTQFDVEFHDNLIATLRYNYSTNSGTYESVENARIAKLELFNPSKLELVAWMEDIQKISDSATKNEKLLKFYQITVQASPIVQYWRLYLEVAIQQELPQLEDLFLAALESTVYDFQNCNQIWSIILEYYSKSFDKLLKYHLLRLGYCHQDLESSFQEFSSFISQNDSKNYESHMKPANRIYSRSKKRQRYYEVYELRLSRTDLPDEKKDIWIEYIQQISKYPQDKIKAKQEILTIFNRAIDSLSDHSSTELELWLGFIFILYDPSVNFQVKEIENLLSRFINTFPDSCLSYAEYIRNCRIFEDGFQKFKTLKNRIRHLNYFMDVNESYDSWKIFGLSVLSYEIYYVRTGENLELAVDELYLDIASFVEFATTKNNDGFHTIEKASISIFEELDDLDNAKLCVSKLLQNFSEQCDVWLYVIEFEKRRQLEADETAESRNSIISGILESAVDNSPNLDWPERIIQEWLSFQQLNNDLGEYKKCLIKANKIITLINIGRLQEEQEKSEEIVGKEEIEEVIDGARGTKRSLVDESSTLAKRNKVDKNSDSHRDRENLTIRVLNLTQNVTEQKLNQFFKDCGTPREINIIQEEGELPLATIEFSNEQEVLTALTKNLKQFDGNTINVQKAAMTTVWVTNYPPSIDHKKLEDYFESIGKIVSARFPSLKFNKNRRFCYIEYESPDVAQYAAKELNGKELVDELDNKPYQLIVKISKPEEKHNRVKVNAAEEGREIFVQNLDFKRASQEILKAEFEKFGTIERITLPLKNHNTNNLNNGFGFITFKSSVSAMNALEMNGKLIEERRVQVTISQPKKHQGPQPTQHNQPQKFSKQVMFDLTRSISILFADDTVNEDQIKHFASPVGNITNIQLYPGTGAKVEFEHVADSGKATMVLSGKEINGKPISVGAVNDVESVLSPENKPKLMIPTSVARRRKRI